MFQEPAGGELAGAPGGVNRQSRLGKGDWCSRRQAEAGGEGSGCEEQLTHATQGRLNPKLGPADEGVMTRESL